MAYLSKASEWWELELQSLGSVQGQHSEGFSPVHFHPFSICSPGQRQTQQRIALQACYARDYEEQHHRFVGTSRDIN